MLFKILQNTTKKENDQIIFMGWSLYWYLHSRELHTHTHTHKMYLIIKITYKYQ